MFNAVFERNAVRNRLLLIKDLAKAFDCIDHELLIAKMHAYGFDIKSLKFIDSYLARRKQRVKINSSFSKWSEVLPWGPSRINIGPSSFQHMYIYIYIYVCVYVCVWRVICSLVKSK